MKYCAAAGVAVGDGGQDAAVFLVQPQAAQPAQQTLQAGSSIDQLQAGRVDEDQDRIEQGRQGQVARSGGDQAVELEILGAVARRSSTLWMPRR